MGKDICKFMVYLLSLNFLVTSNSLQNNADGSEVWKEGSENNIKENQMELHAGGQCLIAGKYSSIKELQVIS